MIVISRFFFLFYGVFMISLAAHAQRIYRPNSVLATGTWYKIAVKKSGVYSIDIPFLAALGINTNNLSSNSIRLYGNGGSMLSEDNAGPWTDDLVENAIRVADGGDGILNGNDHILFYATGPDEWIKDAANLRFSHKKNLYSEESYYFLTIGGTGKRIPLAPVLSAPAQTISSFSERYFYELDTVNFLVSGKEWYGEEFADAPGKTLTRQFSVDLPGVQPNAPVVLKTNCIARSVGVPARFDIKINEQPIGQALINPTNGGIYDVFARETTLVGSTSNGQSANTIQFNFIPGSFNSQGWLNWFEFFTRRTIDLAAAANQLAFRDWQSLGNINGEFVVRNAGNAPEVWEVTDPHNVVAMPGTLSNNQFQFINDCSLLREYVAFNNAGWMQPRAIGKIANQDLHQTVPVDYIIISYPDFLGQAQRLAQLHAQHDGLRPLVVTTSQVFNEFGSGSPDPTALRDFVKMYHDKYGNDPANRLKYLLLFGDASYDYKNRLPVHSNLVPAYENNLSLDPLSTYTSDDFFGFLDDNENINSGTVLNLLDIGIGRVPVKNAEEAKNFVDKVSAYLSAESFGPWRNTISFVADDEDNNLHLQDAETIAATAASASPVFDQQKIYLDAFQQENGAGGSSYPQANQAIANQFFNGTLIWNYSGHGGARRLAEETILDQGIINQLSNANRLPLFITATCDFAAFDNPAENSIGENILVRPKTGAIGLLTTTRVVFAYSNRIINNNYISYALTPDANGNYKTLGESLMEAKNYTYQNLGDVANNRKFTLLGDPALKLGFPQFNIRLTKVNGIPAVQADTLKATDKVVMEGEITDHSGNKLADYQGNIYASVYDKPQVVNTLGNDPGSQVTAFENQVNVLFKGKASVSNGEFSFSFKVPKDINYQFGNGKLSLYAADGTTDASGYFTNFIVGGTGNGLNSDQQGPEIKAYLNDEQFVNGGLANQDPVLLLKLADSSGINTVGTGIGHDIVATLDGDSRQYFILNDFYQGNLNSFQQGEVRFQLPELLPGSHSLTIKAWDILNNSTEVILDFIVAKDEELTISHVLNYPNPFSTHTSFWFEHNKPGQDLIVNLQIFTLSGRIIKKIQKTINTTGNRSMELEWDGKDDFGDKIGRGVYLYKLSVTLPGKKTKEKIEKILIF